MQLDGFTVVAEFGSRFEADLAAERLADDGIETTVLSDPAHQVAPHIVTQPGHRILVTDADSHSAYSLLAANDSGDEATLDQAEPAQVGLGRRPRWMRWMAYALAIGFLGPLVLAVAAFVLRLIDIGA